MKIFSLKTYLMTGLALSLLNACKDPSYPDATPATGPSTESANVTVINTSPDAPTLNALVNNTQIGSSISFNQATGYQVVPVGANQVKASAASGTIGGVIGSGSIVYRTTTTGQTNFTFNNAGNYTFIITDTLTRPKPTVTSGTNPGGPQFIVITDNLSAPAAGKAGVRFLNMAPNAQQIDLIDLSTGNSIFPTTKSVTNSSTGNSTTLTNYQARNFRELTRATTVNKESFSSSITGFTAVTAGAYSFEIRNNGTPATGTHAITPVDFDVTLVAGKLYTIYLAGKVGSSTSPLTASVVTHN